MTGTAPSGVVVSIHTVQRRNGVAEAVPEASVVADYGIQGDFRSRHNSDRQLTLIEEESLQATGERLGHDVPPGASRRQVVVRGIPLAETMGRTVRAGDLVLAVAGPCDPCDNMEVKIGPGARAAMRGWGGVCARVVQGGQLRVGDDVTVDLDAGLSPELMTEFLGVAPEAPNEA